jgi:hypothetical protein
VVVVVAVAVEAVGHPKPNPTIKTSLARLDPVIQVFIQVSVLSRLR